ncbi:MAG: helix-turn-helix transcriptional regulator [Halieaceae bacterium]|nr:helix-turn-helix transcriptional regulator [Halieaceae bacterium]
MLLKQERVKNQRLEKGWTQEQLAELAGISVRTVQRLEKTGVASMETTNALAAVFEVERVSLLAGEGDDDVSAETGTASAGFAARQLIVAVGGAFVVGLLVGQLI